MRNCNIIKLKSCFAILMMIILSGCAAFLTERAPLQSKLEDGEKSVGGFVKYKYSGSLHGNVGMLEKTPQCAEVIEKVRVAKKYPRGIVFIFPEMVFFGLGFIDDARVRGIVEGSKIVQPLAKFESSNLVVCGETVPAAFEK